ncbi:hypothetical protein [Salinicoccus roseus]|uniref:hypothetical protein n=1 Tax=Salinicoccus roseus TaxID=45670 RepID=UPI00117BD054|nr:hypothetical protein [Salinicoccus roseus]
MDDKKDSINEEYDYPRKKRTNLRFNQSVRVDHDANPGSEERTFTESVKGNEQGPLPRSIFLNDEKQEGDPDHCSDNG